MKVVVIGAGVAGLAAALACGRAGHEVTLLERDQVSAPDDPRDAFDWDHARAPTQRVGVSSNDSVTEVRDAAFAFQNPDPLQFAQLDA